MKKKFLQRTGAAVLAAGLSLSLLGCGAVQPGENATMDLTAELTPGEHQETSPLTEEQAVVLTDFGLRLAWHSMTNWGNKLVSPMSAATALGMTANGAAGSTLTEMETVLGMEKDALNDALYAYWRDLPETEKAELRPANSIWLTNHEQFTVEQDFLQSCVDDYGADVFQTPMDGTTCKALNQWVKDKTDGMIPKLLDEVPPSTVAYLVNALAFAGGWEEPYETHQVENGVFLTDTGMPVRTQLLHSEEGIYLENDQVTGVMKPYAGGKYAFVGLLPKKDESLMALLDELDGESLQGLLRNPEYTTVRTIIPKFKTAYEVDLRDALVDMGMQQAFDVQQADFSQLGTSDSGNLWVNRVLHKTFLELAECGTRAGAATVVEVADGGMLLEEYKEVFLDQPFVYLLIDTETCVPFFIGTMQDPTESLPEPICGGAPMMVKVDGKRYASTGKHSDMDGRCGTMDGEITSTVAVGEEPTQDNQSNFGTGWGYQVSGTTTVEMNFGRHWIVFEQVR